MKDILRMLLGIGIFLIVFVFFTIVPMTPIKVLILFGTVCVIAFIVAGIQIYLDRKNLAKLDEITDEDEDEN